MRKCIFSFGYSFVCYISVMFDYIEGVIGNWFRFKMYFLFISDSLKILFLEINLFKLIFMIF